MDRDVFSREGSDLRARLVSFKGLSANSPDGSICTVGNISKTNMLPRPKSGEAANGLIGCTPKQSAHIDLVEHALSGLFGFLENIEQMSFRASEAGVSDEIRVALEADAHDSTGNFNDLTGFTLPDGAQPFLGHAGRVVDKHVSFDNIVGALSALKPLSSIDPSSISFSSPEKLRACREAISASHGALENYLRVTQSVRAGASGEGEDFAISFENRLAASPRIEHVEGNFLRLPLLRAIFPT
jgi:hypothetical protein